MPAKFRIKRNPKALLPRLMDWNWADELPEELERWFQKIVQHRLNVIFSDDGANGSIELVWQRSRPFIAMVVNINEYDAFARGMVSLEEFLREEACVMCDDEDRRKFAKELHRIADDLVGK